MKDDEAKLLGQRIGLCEKIAGSRTALAELTGISSRTLENYSHGRNDPKAAACVAIARATDVSIEWLLTGQGSPVNEPAPDDADADRKIIFNIAYFLASKSRAVKADPDEFADLFLSLFDYCREKQLAGGNGFDAESFENVVEFASKQFHRNSA
jgi:transcriptional regulator with XRE-family HTH domain